MTKGEKVVKSTTKTVSSDEYGFPKYGDSDKISNEKTQIICILDRSGSMSENGIIHEAISGFNNFIEEQKKLKDKASLTVALFDDRYDLLYDNVDIQDVPPITNEIWTPRGMTALYDAIGKTINTVKANHAKTGQKPDKVLVCIVTDGQENASQEYRNLQIKKLIKECEDEDWNFIYLAANQDAFHVGSSFGVSGGNTYSFKANAQGAHGMSMTLSSATTLYRSMSKFDDNYQKRRVSLLTNQDEDENNKIDNVSSTGNVEFTKSKSGMSTT